MMDARKTNLFKALKPCIRKEDHKELARMLQMVMDRAGACCFEDKPRLVRAFVWSESPQGHQYWWDLESALIKAGFGDVA